MLAGREIWDSRGWHAVASEQSKLAIRKKQLKKRSHERPPHSSSTFLLMLQPKPLVVVVVVVVVVIVEVEVEVEVEVVLIVEVEVVVVVVLVVVVVVVVVRGGRNTTTSWGVLALNPKRKP